MEYSSAYGSRPNGAAYPLIKEFLVVAEAALLDFESTRNYERSPYHTPTTYETNFRLNELM